MSFFNIKINNVKLKIFVPDLLILIVAIISWVFIKADLPFSYMIYILLFLLIVLSIYIKLYAWRKLEQSVLSFIFFSLNVVQLLMYIIAISVFFNIYKYNIYDPVYLDDLSIIAQYRYLVLTLISVFIIIGFIIVKFFYSNLSSFSFLTFPYLKEEIRRILYTWNHSFIGDLCVKLIDSLYFSVWFRILFFIMHFVLFYFTRLFSTILLFQCAFFHGDFRNFIYITPFMFLIWLLSFFNHYFITFQQGSANYIRSLISATLDNKNPTIFGFVKLDSTSQVYFTLTKEAIAKGYSDLDINHLAKEWYIQMELTAFFSVYLKLVNYLNYLILLLQLVIWYYITQIFFFPLLKQYVLSVNFFINIRSLGKYAIRPYVTEARRVLPPYQKELSKITEGTHKGDHPALVDPAVRNPDDPREIRYEGQPTHGTGTSQNPSYPLHHSKDLQGDAKPQNFVPPPRITYAKEYFFDPNPVQGSQSLLNDSEVKVNLAKYSPQEENT